MQLGLNQNQGYNTNFLTVVKGKLRKRVASDTKGAISRTITDKKTNESKVVYELVFNSVAGYIDSVFFKDSNFGRRFILVLTDGQDKYSLEFGRGDNHAISIYKMLSNVDVNKPLEVSVGIKDDKTSVFLKQETGPIKWAFTKENPQDLPAWEQKEINGEKVWDKTEQLNYFETKVVAPFIEKLKERGELDLSHLKKDNTEAVIDYSLDEEVEESLDNANVDDIPF